ncbi:hypothetical protein NUH86_01745 [Sphingobium sp. JS3065]|uniref:hypothetical protein n=1 Tax=Sphingobium sp. JS3065 TaxID=2970925 RepID=UPI0022651F75|nr:hypothetical protein [Sphingobium sp. JS3065]UZW55554.1 hypothetical protein NUH86_01745 [Sphingobium sp. JS3065]
MSSVREQIFQAVFAKIVAVRDALEWATAVRNPSEPLGDDQLNALFMQDGGLLDPRGLSGGVQEDEVEFSIGLLVREKESAGLGKEALVDAGFVAVMNALLDPSDIQLGGLVEMIEARGGSDPVYGRAKEGARVIGGLVMDFSARFLTREGDASQVGP